MLSIAAEERLTADIVVEDIVGHSLNPRIFGQFLNGRVLGSQALRHLPTPDWCAARQCRRPHAANEDTGDSLSGGTDIDFVDWRDMIDLPDRAERPVTVGSNLENVTNRFGHDDYFTCVISWAAKPSWCSISRRMRCLKENRWQMQFVMRPACWPMLMRIWTQLPEGMPDWPAVRAGNGSVKKFGCGTCRLVMSGCLNMHGFAKPLILIPQKSRIRPWQVVSHGSACVYRRYPDN